MAYPIFIDNEYYKYNYIIENRKGTTGSPASLNKIYLSYCPN